MFIKSFLPHRFIISINIFYLTTKKNVGLEYNVVYSFTTNPTYVTEEKIFVVEQAGSLPNLSVSHLPTTYCLILEERLSRVFIT